jgi:rhodanese-related sulfurtransferase
MHPMRAPSRRYHVPSALRRSSLRVEPDAVRELLAEGAVLVDVRRREDDTATLEHAIRIAPDEIPQRLPEFRRDVAIVLACT